MYAFAVTTIAMMLASGDSHSWPELCSIRSRAGRWVPSIGNTRHVVRDADVIVRATAVRADSAQFQLGGEYHPTVILAVTEIIVGSGVPDSVRVYGWMTAQDDFNTASVPYPSVRQAGQRGSCYAEEYRSGGEYLLLLKRRGDQLTPYWAPLAPTNEQVRGPDDLWITWVQHQRRHAHN